MKVIFFGVIAVVLAGCMNAQKEVIAISFEAQYKGQQLECGKEVIVGQGQPGVFWLKDLRFFVHDVEVQLPDGKWVPTPLVADNMFQSKRVALLDFENAQGACAGGTPLVNTVVKLKAPSKATHGIRFRLGVPLDLNHVEPASQQALLTETSMSLEQKAGHRFFRFDMVDSSGNGLRSHIGSTGCEQTSTTTFRCERPNIAIVELQRLELRSSVIVLETVEFLSRLDANRKPVLIQCTGSIDSDHCGSTFVALGLDLISGKPGESQLLFRSK